MGPGYFAWVCDLGVERWAVRLELLDEKRTWREDDSEESPKNHLCSS